VNEVSQIVLKIDFVFVIGTTLFQFSLKTSPGVRRVGPGRAGRGSQSGEHMACSDGHAGPGTATNHHQTPSLAAPDTLAC
jgi:hypothetical protein